MKIPTVIDLPFGYEIEVKQLPHKAFVAECGAGVYAMWDVDDKTIYLNKSRPIKKRRADLVHELGHAVLDLQVKVLGSGFADSRD